MMAGGCSLVCDDLLASVTVQGPEQDGTSTPAVKVVLALPGPEVLCIGRVGLDKHLNGEKG